MISEKIRWACTLKYSKGIGLNFIDCEYSGCEASHLLMRQPLLITRRAWNIKQLDTRGLLNELEAANRLHQGCTRRLWNLSFFFVIPVAFETAWVLAALVQAHHRISLCSGASLLCRRRASSSFLGIFSVSHFFYGSLLMQAQASKGGFWRILRRRCFFMVLIALLF